MDFLDDHTRAGGSGGVLAGGRKRQAAPALLLLLALALGAAAAAVGPVQAAGSGHSDRRAERLRTQGQAALAARDYDAATQSFTELYRQTRKPDGLYLLGITAEAQGRLLAAQDLLRRFLSDPRFEPDSNVEQESEARRILAQTRPPSGKINIIGSSGTLVYVDARLVGSLPLSRPLLLTPGKHTLLLEDNAHRQQEEIDAAVGRFTEVTYESSTRALLSTELPGVLLLDSYPGLADAAAQKLGQAVEELIQRERLSPFPVALAIERGGGSANPGCLLLPSCQCQLAQKSELEYVLSLRVTKRTASESWQLQLALLDAEVEDEAARSDIECPECDVDKAGAALRDALPALLAKARQRSRAELTVASTPPGAAVRSGGRLLGKTPLVRAVWAGELEVEVSLSGYKTQVATAVAQEGKPTPLAVTLEKELQAQAPVVPQVTPPARERPARAATRPRWRLALGGAVLGLGVVLSGFGGSALAVNDTCLPGTPDTAEACRQIFSTSGVGGALLGVGVSAGAAGILLLAVPGRPPAAPRAQPVASPAASPAPATTAAAGF